MGKIKLFLLACIVVACNNSVNVGPVSFGKRFKNEKAEEYYIKAQEYQRTGPIEKAMICLNRADSIEPNNPTVLNERGLLKSNMQGYDDAIIDLNKSIEFTPDGDDKQVRYNNRALVHLEAGKTELACEDWKKAGPYGEGYLKKYCK